jgi:sulfane dehydrogenase subunit SoxC
MNGEALRPEQGYPLRAVMPGWEGNLWVKWLRRIEVGDQPWQAREETSKYTDLLADGRSRRFTFIMDAKSVVTNPSPQAPLKHKGRNVLSGLAWSGRGTIRRVDVTLDGGKNWQHARIDGPVLDKSLTRFYVDFDWAGQDLLIQSRAMDSTGYRAADQGRAAQGPRHQLDLPQQRHPDLACEGERGDRECRDRLSRFARRWRRSPYWPPRR